MKLFSHHSLQVRIQVWYGSLILMVCCAFSAIAINYAYKDLYGRRDFQLNNLARDLRRAWMQRNTDNQLASNPQNEGDFKKHKRLKKLFKRASRKRMYYAIYDRDGEVLYRHKKLPAQTALLFPERTPLLKGKTINRKTFREHYLHLGDGLYIVTGSNARVLHGRLVRAVSWITLIAGSVFTLALIGGWLIVVRTLKPLKDIHQTAEAIADGQLQSRIKADAITVELSPLVSELNSAFESLQNAFESQKRLGANVSHELRTPVAALLAEVESTLHRTRDNAFYQNSLRNCHQLLLRLKELMLQLSTLSQLENADAFSQEHLALPKILHATLAMIAPLAEQKSINLSLSTAPCTVIGTQTWLQQAISSILANAVTHTPEGGSISVAQTVEQPQTLITITDTGAGIDESDLPHIFERYYRAQHSRSHSSLGNSGLGLAIAKEVVNQMGGTIKVHSQVGQGTRFTITLPCQATT